MKNVAWIVCLCGLLSAGLAAGAPAPKSSTPSNNGRVLYKWVDKDGETHYGDHVPPEYATQEQHILNSKGYEIRRLDGTVAASGKTVLVAWDPATRAKRPLSDAERAALA